MLNILSETLPTRAAGLASNTLNVGVYFELCTLGLKARQQESEEGSVAPTEFHKKLMACGSIATFSAGT